jgi:uncharacterized protein YaaQ
VKLVMSIVHSDDADRLLAALTESGYGATIIGTTGGFLRHGNATVLVGTEDEKVEDVLGIIRDNCHTRERLVSTLPPVMDPGEMIAPSPVEVQVGGATVFVLDVVRFERC